jgi:hypothetical protein
VLLVDRYRLVEEVVVLLGVERGGRCERCEVGSFEFYECSERFGLLERAGRKKS